MRVRMERVKERERETDRESARERKGGREEESARARARERERESLLGTIFTGTYLPHAQAGIYETDIHLQIRNLLPPPPFAPQTGVSFGSTYQENIWDHAAGHLGKEFSKSMS